MADVFVAIPARNDVPWYTFKITLSNVVYTLLIRYNGRMRRWIMNIQDASGNDVINGIPLLIGINLAGRFVTAALPPGVFFVLDNTNQSDQPERFAFGTTHTLYYQDTTAS